MEIEGPALAGTRRNAGSANRSTGSDPCLERDLFNHSLL